MNLIERAIQEELKGAILKTVAFFDLFDYPMTLMEAWGRIYFPNTPSGLNSSKPNSCSGIKYNDIKVADIKLSLERLVGEKILGQKDGFYFLAGRGEIINRRLEKYAYAGRKIKRAKKVIRIFGFLPWIKMAAIGNLIGAHNLKDESDIDLLIVAERGKIWTARLFSNLITMALNLRPKPGRMKDKICLSFYISEDSLDLSGLLLENDIYFHHWLAGLIPVYQRGNAYQKFLRANAWNNSCLPNWQPSEPLESRVVEITFWQFSLGKIIDVLTTGLEPLLSWLQIKILPDKIKEKANRGTGVIITGSLIKLHVNDRRGWYRDEWKKNSANAAEFGNKVI